MYKVTLPREFPYEQRIRAGIVVNKIHGFEGELTDEQVKAIQADGLLTVQKIDTGTKPEAKGKTK